MPGLWMGTIDIPFGKAQPLHGWVLLRGCHGRRIIGVIMQTWKQLFAPPRPGFFKLAGTYAGWTLLSGLLLMLSFPRPGWGWLAHVALVPVTVLVIRAHSPRILALCVYGGFALWWIWMLRWLMPVTGGGAVGLAMFMAAYWTAAMLLVRHLHRAYRSAMVITLPLAWVTFELLRGWIPQGGFGWYNLGHSQAPYLPEHGQSLIIQIAAIFGQPGVSFLVAMTNGLIVDFLTRSLVKKRGTADRPRTQLSRTLAVGSLLWATAMIAAMGYGLLAFKQERQATQQSLQMAVIQTAVPQSNKDASYAQQTGQSDEESFDAIEARRLQHEREEEAHWQQLMQMTRQAAATNPPPDVVLWPETMVPRSINAEALALYAAQSREDIRAWTRYAEQITFLAQSLRTQLVVGASTMFNFRFDEDGILEGYSTANSVYVYDDMGVQQVQRYDKIHRVPFGEYLPWVENSDWLKGLFLKYLSPYAFDYSLTPGAGPVVFTLRAAREGESFPMRAVTPICFEDSVPRLVRAMVHDTASGRKQADIIMNLPNDGWFAGTDQPLQHLQIAAFRSVELRVPTARAVNMGVSGFVDSMGRIGPLVQPEGQAGLAIVQVKLDDRSTFYGSVGPVGSVVVGVVTLLLGVWGVFRRAFWRGSIFRGLPVGGRRKVG